MPRRTFLVSPPSPYWRADGNVYAEGAKVRGGSSPREALKEWVQVADMITEFGGDVVVVPPGPPEVFDSVFLADVGRYFHDPRGFVLSSMGAPHRLAEPEYMKSVLCTELGLPLAGQMVHVWEGSSCVVVLPNRTAALAGYGVRASKESVQAMQRLLGIPVLGIKMRDPPHIHLDTLVGCLRTAEPTVLACRSGFAEADQEGWDPARAWKELEWLCALDRSELFEVSGADGRAYGTNFVELGGQVIAPAGISEEYWSMLRARGYTRQDIPLPRLFGDGGGAVACLTNNVTEAVAYGWSPPERLRYLRMRTEILSWVSTYPERELPRRESVAC